MATNVTRQEATEISLPVVAGVVSGQPVLVGDLPGVALTDRDADGNATVKTNGSARVEVVAGAAMAVGDRLYHSGTQVDDNAGGTAWGYALEVIAGAGPVTIDAKIGA